MMLTKHKGKIIQSTVIEHYYEIITRSLAQGVLADQADSSWGEGFKGTDYTSEIISSAIIQ